MRMMATSEPGSAFSGDRWKRRAIMGHKAMSATLAIPTSADQRSMLPILLMYAIHFSTKSLGTCCMVSPSRSFTWVVKMVTAIPEVQPTTMGYGMYLMMVPNLSTPSRMRNTPAISVAMVSPCMPYC